MPNELYLGAYGKTDTKNPSVLVEFDFEAEITSLQVWQDVTSCWIQINLESEEPSVVRLLATCQEKVNQWCEDNRREEREEIA